MVQNGQIAENVELKMAKIGHKCSKNVQIKKMAKWL